MPRDPHVSSLAVKPRSEPAPGGQLCRLGQSCAPLVHGWEGLGGWSLRASQAAASHSLFLQTRSGHPWGASMVPRAGTAPAGHLPPPAVGEPMAAPPGCLAPLWQLVPWCTSSARLPAHLAALLPPQASLPAGPLGVGTAVAGAHSLPVPWAASVVNSVSLARTSVLSPAHPVCELRLLHVPNFNRGFQLTVPDWSSSLPNWGACSALPVPTDGCCVLPKAQAGRQGIILDWTRLLVSPHSLCTGGSCWPFCKILPVSASRCLCRPSWQQHGSFPAARPSCPRMPSLVLTWQLGFSL